MAVTISPLNMNGLGMLCHQVSKMIVLELGKMQGKATKVIRRLNHLPVKDRLKCLEISKKRMDLTEAYKIRQSVEKCLSCRNV